MSEDKKTRQQELEDAFFGEPNALEMTESDDASPITETAGLVHSKVEHTSKSVDPAVIIAELETANQLPKSPHSPVLTQVINFLGKYGFAVSINGQPTSVSGRIPLNLTTDNLRTFLKRGVLLGTLLSPVLASAAPLQVGMSMSDKAPDVISSIYTWDKMALLLLILLGLGTGATLLVKKLKKKGKNKEPIKALKDYEKAKKDGDPAAIAETKDALFTHLMGELPEDKENALNTTDVTSEEDLLKALGYKSKADAAINAAMTEVEKEAVLPEEKTIASLERCKQRLLAAIDKHLNALAKVYEELSAELDKVNGNPFLIKQLLFEKKKIKYAMDYLKWMQTQLLMIIQQAKNECINGGSTEGLSPNDKLAKDISVLKKKLAALLDNRSNKNPGEFDAEMASLEADLDEKISQAENGNLPGFGKDPEELIMGNSLKLFNNGEYDHTTPVHYEVNGMDHSTDLVENAKVQVWVNAYKQIKVNFNFNSNLVNSTTLVIHQNDLYVKPVSGGVPTVSLGEYIAAQQSSGDLPAVPARTEVGPEAEPVLDELAQKFHAVRQNIQNNEFETFGDMVKADDETIAYHTIRIDREYYNGKEKVAIRFTLNEEKWKKSLAGLHQQHDIPKHTVNCTYQNAQGATIPVPQPMISFSVVAPGKKQATVLIPSDCSCRSLTGEVKILFDKDTDFTQEDVKAIFAEVAKRLSIGADIKPVSPQAKQRLHHRLNAISKAGVTPAGSTAEVHEEYEAELSNGATIEQLKAKGLHSIYSQFNPDFLEAMFKTGAILATTTRWSKGILVQGMSSGQDMVGGGATEAFTRIHTKKSLDTWYSPDKPAIVWKPNLFTRMDCYCYTGDLFGSKMPGTFDQRVSPEKLVQQMSQYYNSSHEVMFRDAIDLGSAEYIVCASSGQAQDIRNRLKKIGITQVGGKSLEQGVITRDQFKKVSL